MSSGRNTDPVRTIGAAQAIDHTKEDFTQGPAAYDVIIDNAGDHSFSDLRRVLAPTETCVMIGGPTGRWLNHLPRSATMFIVDAFLKPRHAFFVASFPGPSRAAQRGKR